MAKGYISSEEVALALGLDYSDVRVQLDINFAIEYIEEAVDQYCQTTFIAEDNTDKVYGGSGLYILNLGRFLRNLISVHVINEDGSDGMELTDVVPMPQPYKNGAYRWLERKQLNTYSKSNIFPEGLNNLRIKGDWGFNEVPAAVKMAVFYGVRHFFDLREQSDVFRTESGFGRIATQTDHDKIRMLPAFVRKHLDYWRNSTVLSE